jgi:hypothetical protein
VATRLAVSVDRKRGKLHEVTSRTKTGIRINNFRIFSSQSLTVLYLFLKTIHFDKVKNSRRKEMKRKLGYG